jgi:ubiquinol-cytochrome c reductase iron-sulfur subunit
VLALGRTMAHAPLCVQAPVRSVYYEQKRGYSTATGPIESTSVPDFSKYKKDDGDNTQGRPFAYMMIGATGVISSSIAKNCVTDYLTYLAPSADVLAMAKVEVDLTTIPEGKNVVIKWRGKPIFIRHRTADEIQEANTVTMSELRDPETDADRTKKPEWLVMIGICTHLGCVPIGEAGDYDGWFCPCHGSHYDISGRIRRGPAPTNLAVPAYSFAEDDTKLIIG